MVRREWLVVSVCAMAALVLPGCSRNGGSKSSAVKGYRSGEAQIEKVKPAMGKGNVQGKVLYNGKPVANNEVKLCETFSRFGGGCGGATYTARTDANGEYVIPNVPPKEYEALLARVFDTSSYVFITTGIAGINAAKYQVTADKTFFAPTTHLFKGDLKVISPKAGSKVSAQGLELQWEPYPDAAYYKFSIFPKDTKITSPYINERVEGTSFTTDQPLAKGAYWWEVEAYNSADQKLSESSNDLKFTVQ